jgi:MFS family permease
VTHSSLQAGAVSAASMVPYLLLGLVAGALADRWDRRRLIIAATLARR